MEIIKLTENNLDLIINQTVVLLKRAGLVIYPSDTVYAAVVDAKNERAVKKLIEFKNRPLGKPISVFVSDFKMIESLVDLDFNKKKLLDKLLPGPFTVVLPSKHKVVFLLESEKGTLGVRLVDYSPIQYLIKTYQSPLTATSANLSGRSPHYSIESLLKQLPNNKKKLIDLIVDAGRLPRNKPSTIIDLSGDNLKILRHGDIVFEKKDQYLSRSPRQTKKIAQFILGKYLKNNLRKPIVFIIEGELGVGKTVFVKGIGELLGINNIASPSFVVMYEYESHKSKVKSQKLKIKKLIHLDLYNIEEKEEFRYLKIDQYLALGNLLAIEWGQKAGEVFDLLKEKGEIV